MVLSLIDNKDRKLHTPTSPVLPHEISELMPIIQEMFHVMHEEGGIGLAANQVGISKHLFIMDIPEGPRGIFMNTSITKGSNLISFKEGCLSYPGEMVDTIRYREIHIRYMDINGDMQEGYFHDLPAICVQHEVDHLNGITMHDRIIDLTNKSGIYSF